MEHWKDIKGYEGRYQVSDLGNVRSCDTTFERWRLGQHQIVIHRGRVLRPQPRRHGYLSVWLYESKANAKQYSVHRLVAEAFCEKHDGDTEVNHLNEDKTDNRAENLEWCNHIYNTNYGSAIQRRVAKRINGKASKGVRQLDMGGNVLNEFPSLAEAERQTGIFKSNICRHLKGSPQYTTVGGCKWEYI